MTHEHGPQSEVGAQLLNYGLEVKELVGHVEHEYPVRIEVAQIGRDGLAGQQVSRDRMAAEGVEDEQIELLGLLALQGEPCVAHHHREGCLTVPQVGKV